VRLTLTVRGARGTGSEAPVAYLLSISR
jgi:hypothetical protein